MSAKTVWGDILAVLLGAEASIVPIVVHNPKSQQIAGVILTTQDEVLSLLTGAGVQVQTTTPTA